MEPLRHSRTLLANKTLVGYNARFPGNVIPVEFELSFASAAVGKAGTEPLQSHQQPNATKSRIQVEARLSGGSVFKILGLAICRTGLYS
jgi:hypothetical protein